MCQGRLSLVNIGWDDHRGVVWRGFVGDCGKDFSCQGSEKRENTKNRGFAPDNAFYFKIVVLEHQFIFFYRNAIAVHDERIEVIMHCSYHPAVISPLFQCGSLLRVSFPHGLFPKWRCRLYPSLTLARIRKHS